MGHMIGSGLDISYIDKRKVSNPGSKGDPYMKLTTGVATFTANAGGTTTTIVGANATPATETNVVRLTDRFRLYTAAGVLKEETVFEITAIAVAGSTTVTFSPAAAVATISTDVARMVDSSDVADEGSLDERLTAIGGHYSTNLKFMNQNDKIFALRTADDPGSI